MSNRSGQTVKTEIRLLLRNQSDQSLKIAIPSDFSRHYSMEESLWSNFKIIEIFQVFDNLGTLLHAIYSFTVCSFYCFGLKVAKL